MHRCLSVPDEPHGSTIWGNFQNNGFNDWPHSNSDGKLSKLYSYFMETSLIWKDNNLQISLSDRRVMYNFPHIKRSIHGVSGYNLMLYVWEYNNTKLFYQLPMLLRLIVPPFTECSSFSEIGPGEKKFVLLQMTATTPCFMWLLYLGILKLLRF